MDPIGAIVTVLKIYAILSLTVCGITVLRGVLIALTNRR